MERNRIIFTNKSHSLDHCIYCIANDVLLWLSAFKGSGMISHTTHPDTNTVVNLRLFQMIISTEDGEEEVARVAQEEEE